AARRARERDRRVDRGGARAAMKAAALLAAAALASSLPAHELPLGDGRASSVPRAGYVMSCEAFRSGAPGAFRSGDWIANGHWDPARKPLVEGEVSWPNARIDVAVEGNERVVR